MPDNQGCPPCKIIIDGGRLAAAADLLGDVSPSHRPWARYLSSIVRWNTNAITEGIRAGRISSEMIDEAHAWSELQCHRAAAIEGVIGDTTKNRIAEGFWEITPHRLGVWAEEDRLHATKLAGGEYRGAWEISGVDGIRRKPSP